MNPRILASILFAALLPAAAAAQPPADALTVDCADPRPPSQRAVAEFTGIANFSHAYAARERLMLDAQRACKRGAAQVRLVRRAGVGPELVVVADSGTKRRP